MMTGPNPMLSKYRLLARLGSGGMAEVYLVLSEGPGGFNKLQVLKLMRSDLTDQERPDFLQMFQDEARLAARLNHPNIVQSYEVGAEDGQPFIIMEFLEGQPLHRVQQRSRHRGGGFPLERELFVLCQVLEGLDYAHRLTDYDGTPLNIVHRDVSPQNVFITYAGQTKLVDFGVAKTLESSKTRAGVVKGKVAYMPPEQVTGGSLDHRADLFSVGVLLWEAIAGQPMHADLSVYESLSRLVKGELPKIRDVAPEVPRPLERIVQRALELDPSERYPDAESFRHDLHEYLDSLGKVTARQVGESVAHLFARERSDLSQIIRKAMTSQGERTSEPGAGLHVTRRVPVVGAARPSDPPDLATLETPTTRDSGVAALHGSEPPKSRKAPRRWWLTGATASALVAIVATAVLVLRSDSTGARNLPQPSESEASALPQPVEREQVSVVIEIEPPEAAILLDGRVLGQNPYRAHEPRDQRDHLLLVTAPGFLPHTQTVRFERDLSLRLKLESAAQAVTETSSGARSSSTKRESTRRSASVAQSTRPESAAVNSDPYVDLPAPKHTRRQAPELDKSDPWEAERSR